MPLVRIDMWPGRDRETKDRMIRNVTKAVCESIGCPPDAVQIMLYEVDKADWARGGVSSAQREAEAKKG
ncbi:MAG TPA: tautomerase family protein [Chloroflexota bacterium]|nr:tautomerase family protein [Chloroflexota bacterium]HEX2988257.1 tautomerase family protein [Chloroflexota bacterium]